VSDVNIARGIGRAAGWAALGLGVATVGYAALVGAGYYRYGHPRRPTPDEVDPVLDRFMPVYEVAERHHIRVNAPADVTLNAATEVSLRDSGVVHAIFRARELVLGAEPQAAEQPPGLLAETLALGWRVLHDEPGSRIVVGAATKPWHANVVFRGVAPEAFKEFSEPDYVKIVWTIRVEPAGPSETICRTETRVVATDAAARARFRWYWARFAPGIILIRQMLMRQLKAEAERRVSGTGRQDARYFDSTTRSSPQ
jgi:hypothetical protein